MNLVFMILNSFVMVSSLFYFFSKILNKKYDYKNYKVYLFYTIIMIINLLCWYFVSKPLKIIILTLVFSIYIFCMFRENFIKSILTSIFYQFVLLVSELLFATCSVLIFNINISNLHNFSLFLANSIITLISIIIVNFKFVRSFYSYLTKITFRIKKKQLLIVYLLIILIADIFGMLIYYKVSYLYLLVFNTLFTLFCFYIVIYSFKTKDNYIRVYDKYNTTLNSLKEYEEILDKYKISNHENKNELLTIRNMIPKKEKNIISYIDKIIDNKLKDNEKIMFEVSRIPSGGLRGLIYSKILLMKDNNIQYGLEISKNVKTIDFIKLDENLILDICKIIGVYLDNSIEEVKKLKNKYISIEMYTEKNNLIIAISNNYKGVIEIEKIEEKGYTSKGKGHGYGLCLVRDLIKNNNKLMNKKSISKETFCQQLIIKL